MMSRDHRLTVIRLQAGIRGKGVDSHFRGSDGREAHRHFHTPYVARRGMGNYYENRCPPSFRRRPESRGGAVDSCFRGSDGREADRRFYIPYVARRGVGNYYENSEQPSTVIPAT